MHPTVLSSCPIRRWEIDGRQWIPGKSNIFEHWSNKEPNNANKNKGGEPCMHMHTCHGKWNDSPCKGEYFKFHPICKGPTPV